MRMEQNYLQWEKWFIDLGCQAALRCLDINVNTTQQWIGYFEKGVTPAQALNIVFGEKS